MATPISPKAASAEASTRIGARLSSFHEQWRAVLPDQLYIHVKRGYHWTWLDNPPSLKEPRLLSQKPEIQAQVQTLLDLGAIYEVPNQPCFLSRIFVIPKDPVGSRLILDVSDLNKFLKVPTFKMSNHSSLSKLLPTPAWMASLDLKDAYLHVPIRNNLHKFLALTCWGKLFFFRALPFGLATAPWLFTTLVESVLGKLRNKGFNILAYIDDLVLWNKSKDELQVQVQETISLLKSLGLTINVKKSNPSPSLSLTWVGVIWDSHTGTWFPKQRNLDEIQSLAIRLRDSGKGSRRQWERLCGIIAFVAQVNRRAKHYSHLT